MDYKYISIKMDLVSRLKKYITATNIPITQFADICGIARPTLSQLLNGRNKKVSDEVVAKIHAAFPRLSVYWLMFGEGSMEISENIEFSESKNVENDQVRDVSLFENQLNEEEFGRSGADHGEGKSGIIEFFDRNDELDEASAGTECFVPSDGMVSKHENSVVVGGGHNGQAVSIAVNQGEGKRISNIVVFYSDNSFQSFYPA